VLPTIPDDLRFSLTDAPGDDSYPVSGTVWAILSTEQSNPELGMFLHWATHDGQAYLAELQFAQLPPELVKLIEGRLARISANPPR
jgi:phosphate transport system substrate-binding protein